MKRYDGYTLSGAKKFLRENWEDGVECPCCTQRVQLYKNSFHSGMARVLILISKAITDDDGWVHVENYLVSVGSNIKGTHGKLKHWGMLEQRPNDDKKRASSGMWRITPPGWDFVKNNSETHEHVWTFKDRVYKKSESMTTIKEALGKHFDYSKLMSGDS